MKLTVKELRRIIREAWYDHKDSANLLQNDRSYTKESEYVANTTKNLLKKWYDKMQ